MCVYVCVYVCMYVLCMILIEIKIREATYKLTEYSYAKLSDEANASGAESQCAPLRELWGAEPPLKNSNTSDFDET